MRIHRALPALLWFAAGAACTGSKTSTAGQEITCQVNPTTQEVFDCVAGSGSGGSNTCHDIDEDGDGDPHDADASDDHASGDIDGDHDGGGDDGSASGGGGGGDDGSASDSDGDGIPDGQDCDNLHDGDNDTSDGLPYDIEPQLGATTTPIVDAFMARGGTVPTIIGITMADPTWRFAELQASTPFVVAQSDCDHIGNRDVGRDRVFVTWQTSSGLMQTDHLDIRYCKD